MCCTYQAAGSVAGLSGGKAGRIGSLMAAVAGLSFIAFAAAGKRADCCKKASWAGCENAADINNDAKMKQINLCIERRTMAGCKFTPVGLAGLWWLPIANKFYKWLSDKV
jgi:hypothetical protein